jgi:uncharacterized protein (TIGR02453 family)
VRRFEGFPPEVCAWFEGLEADNTREYFAATRDFFERSVRGQLEALLAELSARFEGQVKLFRQHRDVRFSPDKSPYKTHTYGIVHGPDVAGQGLYASISARGLVAGAGYHVMTRDQLERYRDRVADDQHGPALLVPGGDAAVAARHHPRRRAPVRRQDVARRGARDGLARRARRPERLAG